MTSHNNSAPSDDVTVALPALFRAEHVARVAPTDQPSCELWEVLVSSAGCVVLQLCVEVG
jgi:hypothetical protein